MSCPLTLWISLLATRFFLYIWCGAVLFQVMFRCDDYWIINKSEGVSFHSELNEMGLIQTLSKSFPEQTFFPVHRLDKMTSGLLIVACHKEAAAMFGAIFENHEVEKRYLAFSMRKPKKKQGTIAGGMEPSRRGQWKLTQGKDNFAITQFFSAASQGGRAFIIRPLTGKTHQIRVALKSIGSPIFGDTRYGGEPADRGYLHAYALYFDWYGEKKSYVCPPTSGEMFTSQFMTCVETQLDDALLKWSSRK